ncbi:hypothetical protein [Virgibacillus proomii]|uniref:hypothetical protein n=1 Tax=Virgibacillus proomii TaxID=84407 RepID=UPI0009845862|nr:hypothetical protein [Virgibacillus proomii]
MNNNIVELPINKEEIWMPKSIDELVTIALETVPFVPINKNASGDDWEYDEGELYLDGNGEILMGHLVYEDEEFIQEGIDGDIVVTKQIFIIPEGECLVFYTTAEENYCGSCEKVHCRFNRIISAEQSLSSVEKEEVLCRLVFDINNKE